MKRRVDELLKEIIELDPPSLLSSVGEVRVSLQKGQQYQSTLRIGCANGQKIRGFVCSDNHRIVFAQDEFSGSSCSVMFGIDTYGLAPGDVVNGKIMLLTSIGEKEIPVTAAIEDKLPEPYDKIENLDNFARLAAKNFREAFLMYTDEKFLGLLRGKNRKYIPLYRGLSVNPVSYQHLEEFLISAGKKEPVRLSLDKQERMSYVLNSSIKDTLYLYKNTWGYTRIEISVQGDFIEPEKKVITSDDFIGRVYGLEYILNRDRLNGRRCTGRIVLKTVYEELSLEIEASPYAGMELVSSRFRKIRMLKIFRAFLALQLKKLDYRTWYDSSKQWITEIKEETEDFFTLYADAYLAFCQEEKTRLAELLWPIKTGEIRPQKPWEKAVYLYLAKEAGILPEEEQKIAPKLYAYYQQEPEDYITLALYLKELENQGYHSPWDLSELEKVYERGCRSPFLYLRAWRILSGQESLLRKLSPFLIRVLLFAQKQDMLTEGLLLRTAHLSANIKKFHPTLYRLLAAGYEKTGRKELLEAICRHIMNDRPTDPAYFHWYEKAVETDVRLTRLYEYYIETRPEDLKTPMPMPVKLYFSYNSTIGERKKTCLYAAVVEDKENDPISFENYEKLARDHAAAALKKGKINEYYAVLYREFYHEVTTAENAGYLAEVLFAHRLTVTDPKVRRVVVCHPALRDMQSYAITDGTAYPKIYSKDACILFEDEKKRRFGATVSYQLKQLLDVDRLAKSCMLFGIWDTGMQLYCCHERTWQMEINSRNLMSFWKAAENLYFTREYRDRTRRKLLEYFNRHTENWALIPYAESLKELTYGVLDKEGTFELLIRFGQYDKAFNLVNRQGCEGIRPASLLKLAAEVIRARASAKDEEVLDLACHIYRSGFFNDDVLEYVSKYAICDLAETEKLWKDMRSFGMDTYELEEKYLLRSMFVLKTTDACEKIFQHYTAKSGKPAVRRAYLNFLAILYLLKDRPLGKDAAQELRFLCEKKKDHVLFARLAWLKGKAAGEEGSFACQRSIEAPQSRGGLPRSQIGGRDDADKALMRRLLADCARENLRFGFFRHLPADVIEGFQLEDKVFAEESLPSGSKAVIHYCIEGADGTRSEKRSEPFKESIRGLFVREFLLFFGETLHYFCTVSAGDESFETEEKVLRVEESETKGMSRYQLLNRMLMQKSLGADDRFTHTMKQYLWQEAFVEEMFVIQGEDSHG